MFKKKPLILPVLALAAAMLLSTQAQADTLTLTLDNPTQSGAPGDLLLSFTATVITPGTNTGTIFMSLKPPGERSKPTPPNSALQSSRAPWRDMRRWPFCRSSGARPSF